MIHLRSRVLIYATGLSWALFIYLLSHPERFRSSGMPPPGWFASSPLTGPGMFFALALLLGTLASLISDLFRRPRKNDRAH